MVNLKAKMAAGGASNASVTMMEVVFSEGVSSPFSLSPFLSCSHPPSLYLPLAL